VATISLSILVTIWVKVSVVNQIENIQRTVTILEEHNQESYSHTEDLKRIAEKNLNDLQQDIDRTDAKLQSFGKTMYRYAHMLKSLRGLIPDQSVMNGLILDRVENVPTGTIVAYAVRIAPEVWLICDGSEIPNEDRFMILRQFIGNFTPDLRGYFLRGLDSSGRVDPDGSSRHLLSVQLDQLAKHSHNVTFQAAIAGHGGDDDREPHGARSHSFTVYTSVNGGLETRPKNVAANYIIKY